MGKDTQRRSPSGPADPVFEGAISFTGGETLGYTLLGHTGSVPTHAVVEGSYDTSDAVGVGAVAGLSAGRNAIGQLVITVSIPGGAGAGDLPVRGSFKAGVVR